MEVVDVGAEPQGPGAESSSEAKDEKDLIESEDHRKFLDDLDARIAQISSRNDAHASDPVLQRRPLPGSEEPIEGETKGEPTPAPEPMDEKPKRRKKEKKS
jgi:hypothetical protein